MNVKPSGLQQIHEWLTAVMNCDKCNTTTNFSGELPVDVLRPCSTHKRNVAGQLCLTHSPYLRSFDLHIIYPESPHGYGTFGILPAYEGDKNPGYEHSAAAVLERQGKLPDWYEPQ